MINDFFTSSTEASSTTESSRHRSNNHIHVRRTNAKIFRHTPPMTSQHAKRPTFIQYQSILVFLLQFNLSSALPPKIDEENTTLGKSTISPKFSLNPSVTINLLVKGFLERNCSTLISSRTLSKSSISLCSYHRTVDLEICRPF